MLFRSGEDVVQLYLQDMVSSVATPDIMLKDFEKISLKKGESKRITFILGKEQLSLYNSRLEEVVEPGEFKVMIGSASNDIKLTGQFTIK